MSRKEVSSVQQLVYLNGGVYPYEDARVHVDDRGFTFADGIYEVVRVYDGTPFEIHRHMRRLRRSAAALWLRLDPGADEIEQLCREMVRRQQLLDAQIYIQVTRGSSPRAHAIPANVRPSTMVIVCPPATPAPELVRNGAGAITVPDDRWGRCDVKVIALTPNVLAKQQAVDAGAFEAIFIRDGYVTDCSACNVFAVFDGALYTAPRSNAILAGVTREVTLELAAATGIPVNEESFRVDQLREADEILVTGTNTRILPITRLDGTVVGSGEPGEITRRLLALFDERTGFDSAAGMSRSAAAASPMA
jgi:D-alanine transaminase